MNFTFKATKFKLFFCIFLGLDPDGYLTLHKFKYVMEDQLKKREVTDDSKLTEEQINGKIDLNSSLQIFLKKSIQIKDLFWTFHYKVNI